MILFCVGCGCRGQGTHPVHSVHISIEAATLAVGVVHPRFSVYSVLKNLFEQGLSIFMSSDFSFPILNLEL